MNKQLAISMVCAFLCILPLTKTTAQENDNGTKKNAVRMNLLPLAAKTYAFEYERVLVGKLTAVGMFSHRAENNLPFFSFWSKFIDDEQIRDALGNMKQGATSYGLEARLYTSRKGPMRGFYIAPYIKSATYTTILPLNVDIEAADINHVDVDGKLKTFTAGLGIGTQFSLGKRLTLDWRLIAPGYGNSSGTLSGRANRPLTNEEVADVQEQLDEQLSSLPIVQAEADVNNEGVNINVKGPWAGIRTALSIGFRF